VCPVKKYGLHAHGELGV